MGIFVIHLIDIHLTVFKFSFCKHPPPPTSFKLMEAPVPTTKLILAARKSVEPLSVCQTTGSGDRGLRQSTFPTLNNTCHSMCVK